MGRQRKKIPEREKLSYEQLVETFVKACGLRKAELERLRVRDFYRGGEHEFGFEEQWIHVDAFEDIPAHEAPYMGNNEWIIAELCKGRGPDDLVFSSLPDLDYEEQREEYADGLFMVYYDSLGATGAPHNIPGLGKLLKGALGLRHYDEKRRRAMRWASRDMRRMAGVL
jgi:hypothetical protein